jgi:DNA polymerase-1
LISADYSQIELRVLAHFSQDRALLDAFERDEDIHAQTACQIFNLKPGEPIDPNLRRRAKTINFGIVYGQGPAGLAKQLGISLGEAKGFIDLYFRRFPGVRAYIERAIKEMSQKGLVSTWYGRRRYLSGFLGSGQEKREAERMAVNTPIQGTAADIVKMAMLKVDRALRAKNFSAKIIMQVHDELILEAPEAEAEACSALLIEEMELVGRKPLTEGAKPLSTPLKVNAAFGHNWVHA